MERKKKGGGVWLLCGKLDPHHSLLSEKNGNKWTSMPKLLVIYCFDCPRWGFTWLWHLVCYLVRIITLVFPIQRLHKLKDQIQNRDGRIRTSFHYVAMIATTFHYFLGSCAYSHFIILLVKHWPIIGTMRVVNQTMRHHKMTFVPFLWEHVFQKLFKWSITYFQFACSSLMESNFHYNNKHDLMLMAFH
jgi:hypothetical protein